jgi:ankyrin repeat protein
VTHDSLPTRTLRERPDLDQLKRQAKELLEAFRAGEPAAITEVTGHYHDTDKAAFVLHDAQLVIARAYGFASWPKLKAFVEGATDQRFVAAVRARDLPQVRAMLEARPELSGRSGALHAAVLDRLPDLVRVLMQHGANARVGIYPHRDATSPLTMATERGYDEIVAIIREEEQRRQQAKSSVSASTDELFEAIRSGNDERALALMESDAALVRTRHPMFDWTPVHVAAYTLNARLVTWLLDHGADVMGPGGRDQMTPLDAAAHQSGGSREGRGNRAVRFATVAHVLLERGAALTARAAVALGNADWLRGKHAEGTLINPIEESGGLLRIAVTHNRPDILALLLECGLDPDERTRFRDVGGDEVVFTWGMPLWNCAASGQHAMAEMLLERGADPNASVYASGTPVSEAYGQGDWKMIGLLERYGGMAEPWIAAQYRQTELAKKRLADATDKRTIAEQLLGAAACGGDPEIVRLALEHVAWPRDDPRWFGVLEQPLRIWNHGSGHWARPEWDRSTYRTCFRLILERCDPNTPGRLDEPAQFGLTILHSVAGSREHVTPEERVAFATMLIDAGARLDVRDNLLKSTPLGWASRWGRVELVRLLLERGANPAEADAEPWATPLAWATKKRHAEIEVHLRQAGAQS